jgi:carboxypeptidase C (cathepsin A)
MTKLVCGLVLGAILVFSNGVRADAPAYPCGTPTTALVTTQHTVTIAGKALAYSASVGFQEIQIPASEAQGGRPAGASEGGVAKACVFFTYYHVDGATRPLTFAFNGGPGSASLWLHLGIMGPERVNTGPDGLTPPAPFQLENNDDSPLDLTDIVMIDPVGTGFSSSEGGSSDMQFFGSSADAESVATFVRDFIDRFDRRPSPVYLMGESYGGIRGTLVTERLQSEYSIPVAGLVLVSPWLSTTTTNFGEIDNDVPYVTFLPSFATTAWYHQRAVSTKSDTDLETVFAAAREFANGRYRDALAQGNALDRGEFHEVAQVLSDFTGIPVARVEALDLRVSDGEFFSALLADESLRIGRYDSRFTGTLLAPTGQRGQGSPDPSDVKLSFPFVSAINYYLRNDLGFGLQSPYIDSGNVDPWPLGQGGGEGAGEFTVIRDMSQALGENPALRVFVASGFYDLACPMGTVEYERERLDPAIDPSRMAIHRYPGGHMMYINPPARKALKADLVEFFGGR